MESSTSTWLRQLFSTDLRLIPPPSRTITPTSTSRWRNVRRFEASRVVATPDGSEPPYYRIAELWFDSHEDLQGSMSSPEGQATVADIGSWATGGATVLIAEVD
ncbi:MAG: EthD family reductase [Solirubrobacteraceae bacterium]